MGCVVGQRFSRDVTVNQESIREFARLVGDENPLHHDKGLAALTRFGGLIASGTHSASIMMGAVAAFTAQFGPSLGLEYSVKLRKPVRAGERLRIEWEVSAIERNPLLGGRVVSFNGRLINDKDETVVSGFAKGLIMANADAFSEKSAVPSRA